MRCDEIDKRKWNKTRQESRAVTTRLEFAGGRPHEAGLAGGSCLGGKRDLLPLQWERAANSNPGDLQTPKTGIKVGIDSAFRRDDFA